MSKNRPTLFQQLQEESAKLPSEIKQLRHSRNIRLAIVVLSPLLAAIFLPSLSSFLLKSGNGYVAIKGQIWQNETIVAQSSYAVRKAEDRYKAEVAEAQAQAPLVFRPRKRVDISPDKARELVLKATSMTTASPILKERLRTVVHTLLGREFINRSKAGFDKHGIVVMPQATVMEPRLATSLLDSSEVQNVIEQTLRDYVRADQLPPLTEEILRLVTPNLEFWPEKTEAMKAVAADNVPHTSGIVRKGEVVIHHGDVLDENSIARLSSYGFVREESPSTLHQWGMAAGAVLHAILIYSVFVLFVFFLRKKIFRDSIRLASLSMLFLFSAAMAWMSLKFPTSYSSEYLILVPAFSMIAAIYFDSRTGFIITVTCALMVAAVRSNDLSSSFALLLAGTLSAYSVRDLRNRTQLFRSIAFIAVGFYLVIIATCLERGIDIVSQRNALGAATINAVLSPLITFAVIAISERYFGVLTDLALHEYDNVNHPLLLEMSEKAPGTYQHTLAIANLVESAAYAIQASPLLARVGAYFHDIGKIPKAEYFIENQIELENKHDLLSPKKSATIIRNHVQDGLELAQEYRLPGRVADFIPMHHGTALVKHFYAKAMEEAEAEGLELQQELFRYPGPKPNSKETALVMLADGVEAVSRTTDDRDELEKKIDLIFKDKIMDGQLDECDLTMKDIATIREVFARNLVGAHHQRIQYKELRNSQEE